jgi:hypothetical protein
MHVYCTAHTAWKAASCRLATRRRGPTTSARRPAVVRAAMRSSNGSRRANSTARCTTITGGARTDAGSTASIAEQDCSFVWRGVTRPTCKRTGAKACCARMRFTRASRGLTRELFTRERRQSATTQHHAMAPAIRRRPAVSDRPPSSRVHPPGTTHPSDTAADSNCRTTAPNRRR